MSAWQDLVLWLNHRVWYGVQRRWCLSFHRGKPVYQDKHFWWCATCRVGHRHARHIGG